ncbi:MAG: alpha/beta hydrolase-fold protein, partial [Lysobacterales bacterium]
MRPALFAVSLVLLALPCAVLAEKNPGVVDGNLHYHHDLDGRCVLPRDVIVWTPPGYEADTERRYPVLYMHDGQNVFDPASSYIGVEWQADETVVRLVEEGVIEPMIVVGLTHTILRDKEYSPGPRGRGYMEFLVKQVKPMIDEKYRTRPGKQHTLTAGASMGGLIACMLGWSYPDVFGAVMCFSPAFTVKGQADWSRFFTESEGG